MKRAVGKLAAVLLLMASSAQASTPQLASSPNPVSIVEVELESAAFAPDKLKASIHLPPGYEADSTTRYPVLYLNDGQDAATVGLEEALATLYAQDAIEKVIVVAIDMLPDRMGTYGLSDRKAGRSMPGDSRYGAVGSRAHDYSEWVARELVPYIDARYRTRPDPADRTILGWSLGGLNAFNLGWQYPDVFGQVGAFSPSFWLASDRTDAASVQRSRLAQRMVEEGPKREGSRFWFAVGTAEETDDRDSDGVIDAVDDTQDLVRALVTTGYTANLEYARRVGTEEVALYLLEGGEHNQASWARILPVFLRWAYGKADAVDQQKAALTGRLERHAAFGSRHVTARNVDVWLPPGYGEDPNRRYPVLYMHDGQNLFEAASSYGGIDWDVDRAMTRLIGAGKVRASIVVGVWNSPRRFQEYMPQKAVSKREVSTVAGSPPIQGSEVVSDAYLSFMVEELKPFIDTHYLTLTGRDDTFIMGSSMGGLISVYAISEYPQVYGGAGCISTHWPAGDGTVVDYLGTRLPDPRTHKLYFDYGTETLDAGYESLQLRMDRAIRDAGFRPGTQWITRKFVGAEHSEKSWRARLEVPLVFLLGK